MNEALALIDKIIEEHRQIREKFRSLEQVANDSQALSVLDRAKKDFLPGRLDDQKGGLQKWQESLAIIDRGIKAHFEREETALLTVFENYGGETLTSTWHVWLTEHEELRNRLDRLKKDVAELAAGSSSRDVWEGRAWGVRVYMTHTWKLFEIHARSEQQLLRVLRNRVLKGMKETS